MWPASRSRVEQFSDDALLPERVGSGRDRPDDEQRDDRQKYRHDYARQADVEGASHGDLLPPPVYVLRPSPNRRVRKLAGGGGTVGAEASTRCFGRRWSSTFRPLWAVCC